MGQTTHHVVEKLKAAGLRPTRQRVLLGCLLWKGCDRHVTAEQLHTEAKVADMPVSMATVYNTLHQFVDAGLLKEVVVSGGRSYFDTNILPHHHYLYEESGVLEDIPAERIALPDIPLPSGGQITSVDVIIRVRN